jgi:uncharacterized protein with NRDE domain
MPDPPKCGMLPRMCLIGFAWRKHPRYRLVLAANRDESHARATAPAQAWPDVPGVHGGRDLEKGGSWLVATASDRMAAVTNVRNAAEASDPQWLSRGELVLDFARSGQAPSDWLAELSLRASRYGPFNLLVGANGELHFASNRPRYRHRPLKPGLHALSNGDLDAPWPKSLRLREALAAWLDLEASMDDWPPVQKLFTALADTREAPDEQLPRTGVPLALERRLSASFINGASYGTRASSVLLMDDAEAALYERRYGPHGHFDGESILRFPLLPGAGSTQPT